MLRVVVPVTLALAGCTAAEPAPTERAPFPALPYPTCAESRQCAPGEECREGVCRPATTTDAGAPGTCPGGCGAGQLCSGGVCIDSGYDAGVSTQRDPCGGCPIGFSCDVLTLMCKTP